MKTNNLFEFATSELSQDAFICWLLNFAHKNHQDEDPILRECAKELLSIIIQTDEELIITKITKQYKNIDVLIEVNGKYNIIIEDKTFTGQHGDQINTYRKVLENEDRKNIICVYYKIIEQSLKEENALNITRHDLIELFAKYVDKTDNNVFKDYYDYLLSIERMVNSYKTEPIENWVLDYGHAYKGFFVHLIESEIIRVNRPYGWQYVANPSGGMRALWWFNLSREELDGCNLLEENVSNLYLQIEDDIIALKITGNVEQTNNIRWSLYNYVKGQVPSFNKKPFKKGKWMTVGYIKYDEKNYLEKIDLMQNIMQSIADKKYRFSSI